MAQDTDVASLCERFWQWRMKESPEFASFCGIHDYDDRLDDISEEAYVKRKNRAQDFLKECEHLDVQQCSRDARMDLQLLQEDLQIYMSGTKYKGHYFPLSFLEGVHMDINLINNFHSFETVEGYRRYLSRLRALPVKVTQASDILKKAMSENLCHHLKSVEMVSKQLADIIAETPGKSIFLKPFRENKTNIPSSELNTLQNEGEKIVLDHIIPSFASLKDFIEKEYNKNLRPSEGISSLKNGREFYQQCLDWHLSCHMTPEEVHEIGLREVERVKSLMLDLGEGWGCKRQLEAVKSHLDSIEELKFHSGDEVVEYIKDVCYNKIRPRLSKIFRGIPDSQLIIVPKPGSESSSPIAYYYAGTQDGSRPGMYFINTSNPEASPRYQLLALSLHEGEPGHHLQSVFAHSQSKLPAFRQYLEDMKYYLAPSGFPLHTAYVEGWGLYSEALGEEMGLYEDPYDLLGRYTFEIFRAARLVVDTGLHALGWDHARAVDYLVDNTLHDRWEMTNEVNRYITWPGQACAYKIGELKLWELRRLAEKKLGDNFVLADFHSVVLNCGPVPLDFLEKIVNEYITEKAAR